MKTITCLIALLLIATNPSKAFTIYGKVEHPISYQIELKLLNLEESKFIEVDDQGNFHQTFSIEGNELVLIGLEEKDPLILFLNNRDSIYLKFDERYFPGNCQVKGLKNDNVVLHALEQSQWSIKKEISALTEVRIEEVTEFTDTISAELKFQMKFDSLVREETLLNMRAFAQLKNPVAKGLVAVWMNPDEPEQKQLIKEAIAAMDKNGAQEKAAAIIYKMLSNGIRFAKGELFPTLTAKDKTGKEMSLKSVKGKVILVDFWASWCGPCRRENDQLVKSYDAYHAKGFEIYSISLDEKKADWLKAIKNDNLAWKAHVSNLLGWDCPLVKDLKIEAIPSNFLIDEKGIILAKNLRGEELNDFLQNYLN